MESPRAIDRRSVCCHAAVLHPLPMGGNRLRACLSLVCAQCGKPADNFEVVMAGEMRIWPLPKGYHAPKRGKKYTRRPSDEDNPVPYAVNLPHKLLKKLLWGVI